MRIKIRLKDNCGNNCLRIAINKYDYMAFAIGWYSGFGIIEDRMENGEGHVVFLIGKLWIHFPMLAV